MANSILKATIQFTKDNKTGIKNNVYFVSIIWSNVVTTCVVIDEKGVLRRIAVFNINLCLMCFITHLKINGLLQYSWIFHEIDYQSLVKRFLFTHFINFFFFVFKSFFSKFKYKDPSNIMNVIGFSNALLHWLSLFNTKLLGNYWWKVYQKKWFTAHAKRRLWECLQCVIIQMMRWTLCPDVTLKSRFKN